MDEPTLITALLLGSLCALSALVAHCADRCGIGHALIDFEDTRAAYVHSRARAGKYL